MLMPWLHTEIAKLVNSRTLLPQPLTAERVEGRNYCTLIQDGALQACVGIRRVQWYQWEVYHLVVREGREGKGLGRKVYALAEEKARAGGAGVLQCTIRAGNYRSSTFFRKQGWKRGVRFVNPDTGNLLWVWQKELGDGR